MSNYRERRKSRFPNLVLSQCLFSFSGTWVADTYSYSNPDSRCHSISGVVDVSL